MHPMWGMEFLAILEGRGNDANELSMSQPSIIRSLAIPSYTKAKSDGMAKPSNLSFQWQVRLHLLPLIPNHFVKSHLPL